jgi:uncharacterized protein YdhG (YjbR/CyaY superfamily)
LLTDKKGPNTIDAYIASCPRDVQPILVEIRKIIRQAAPEAEETIKYQIPTFVWMGNLISFAAYKKHIGLYPAPEGDAEFNRRLAVYKTEKSTVRFPLDKPVPYDLIGEIVRYRVVDNLKRAENKARKIK